MTEFNKFDKVRVGTDRVGVVMSDIDSDNEIVVSFDRDDWAYVQINRLEKIESPRMTVEELDLDYVRSGKVQAIKSLRQVTNCGLKAAKDFVEAIYDTGEKLNRSNSEVLLERVNALEAQRDDLRAEIATLRDHQNKILNALTRDQLIELLSNI